MFAGDIRQRLEDGGKEAGEFSGGGFAAHRDSLPPRLGVDIDEPPVDLAPCRALFQRGNGRTERRIGQHRSIDQHPVIMRAIARRAKLAVEKILALVPPLAAPRQRRIHLARAERRESPWETRRRPRRKGEADRIG